MTKKISFTLIVVISILAITCCVSALADGYQYEYNYAYQYRWNGIVICTNISIRESPSTSAKRYGQLHNGDVVNIVGEQNGWYLIDLKSTGLKDVPDGIGYAKSSLIVSNPYWIVLTKYTPVYANPWWTGKSNGEISSGTPMLVIDENNDFYCVRLHNGQAGVTFVRKYDVGRFNPECEPSYCVVVDGPVDVYNYDFSQVIGTLKTLDLVQVVAYSGENAHIYYKIGDSYYDAWTKTINLQPVIN